MEAGIARVVSEVVGGILLAVFSRWWAKKKPEAVNSVLIQEIEKAGNDALKRGIAVAAENINVEKYLNEKVRAITKKKAYVD